MNARKSNKIYLFTLSSKIILAPENGVPGHMPRTFDLSVSKKLKVSKNWHFPIDNESIIIKDF